MDSLIEFAKYGSAGISIFLIIAIVFIIKRLFDFMENHIKHNTEVVTKLKEKLEQDIEVGKETHQLLRNFNGKK